MTEYDIFAPFYDAVMGNRGDVVRLVESQIEHYLPQARSVLELGCGTGSILAGLANHYDVAGIERSPAMLRQAKAKLPQAQLVRGTIADFKLGRTFDTTICVFDTINHLTRFSQWERLFSSTISHLNPGGLFIFDMNTVGRLAAVAASPDYRQTFNQQSTFHLRANQVAKHTIEWSVAVETPAATEGTIQVYEEYIRETSFPLAQVRQALSSHNFTIIDSFASDGHIPSDSSDRVYFVLKAPKP